MPLYNPPTVTPTNTVTLTNKTLTSTANTITLDAAAGNPIKGTNTNDSAAAGYVGQNAQDADAAVSFATTAQWGDLSTITLEAGDYEIGGAVTQAANGATVTAFQIGISTTSGNSSSGLTLGLNQFQGLPASATSNASIAIPHYRISLSAQTIYYLKFFASYSVATPQAYGSLTARRIR